MTEPIVVGYITAIAGLLAAIVPALLFLVERAGRKRAEKDLETEKIRSRRAEELFRQRQLDVAREGRELQRRELEERAARQLRQQAELVHCWTVPAGPPYVELTAPQSLFQGGQVKMVPEAAFDVALSNTSDGPVYDVFIMLRLTWLDPTTEDVRPYPEGDSTIVWPAGGAAIVWPAERLTRCTYELDVLPPTASAPRVFRAHDEIEVYWREYPPDTAPHTAFDQVMSSRPPEWRPGTAEVLEMRFTDAAGRRWTRRESDLMDSPVRSDDERS